MYELMKASGDSRREERTGGLNLSFNRSNEFQCRRCDGMAFKIVKGTTCIFLECTRCGETDEISRRKLGWDL